MLFSAGNFVCCSGGNTTHCKWSRASQSNNVRDNESRVKNSILHGLRQQHVLKEHRMNWFERKVEEAERRIVEAEAKMAEMQMHVNKTCNEVDNLVVTIQNMTTPELEEQICGLVTDCCQVG